MSEPRVICDQCGDTLEVKPDGRGFPPDIYKRKLIKQCRAKGCMGNPQYRAGITFGPRAHGMEVRGNGEENCSIARE
jgi:hypothetical protein